MRSLFHYFVSLVSMSETIRSFACRGMGPMGFRFELGWIHESDQRLVLSPSPIALPRCLRSRSFPAMMPLHPWEVVVTNCTFVKEVLWQYLLNNILARRLLGLVKILQATFARSAWLKAWTSRKPSLPRLFGCVSESQDFQQIFLSLSLGSHQNLVRTDWICLHRLTGRRKLDDAKFGIAERTDCIIVAFPAVVRNCVDQLATFCLMRWTIEAKRSLFFLPNNSGSPRYFPTPPSLSIPSYCFTLVLISAVF